VTGGQSLGHPGQDFLRDLWEQGTCQNVVDVASAADFDLEVLDLSPAILDGRGDGTLTNRHPRTTDIKKADCEPTVHR